MNYGRAETRQVNWVLDKTKNKRNGFFVEAGALNGISCSNTYLLEKKFNWKGICCEPNPNYKKDLIKNRNCSLEFECLYGISDKAVKFYLSRELSGTYEDFKTEKDRLQLRTDKNHPNKLHSSIINKKTISLDDLLEKYNAPNDIDYISLDTEGSELRIASAFNFNKYNVKLWTIEHNQKFREDGEEYLEGIKTLFARWGYQYKIVLQDIYLYKSE